MPDMAVDGPKGAWANHFDVTTTLSITSPACLVVSNRLDVRFRLPRVVVSNMDCVDHVPRIWLAHYLSPFSSVDFVSKETVYKAGEPDPDKAGWS